MSLFEERLADLPLEIEGYALEGLSRDVSSAFTRASTWSATLVDCSDALLKSA